MNFTYKINEIFTQSELVTFISSLFISFIIIKVVKVKQSNKYVFINEIKPPKEAKPNSKGLLETNFSDKNIIKCYCPATGIFLGGFKINSNDLIDNKIKLAQKAQKQWKKTTFKERKLVLKSLENYIIKYQKTIAQVACRDSGKTLLDASMGEIMVTLEKINWINKYGENVLKTSKRPGPSNMFLKYKKAQVKYEPLGIVSALISWNYPFHNLMGPIISSIFTGNGIIVKCSEQVIWSSIYFIEIVRNIIEKCGYDPELVQLVYMLPENADYLTYHPSISHITFIGSIEIAYKVSLAASKSLTQLVLELGGKDAMIILDSYKDIDSLCSIILRASFQSSGQNCIGIERVILLPENYKLVKKILSRRIKELRLGSSLDEGEGVDMGACISDKNFNHIENLIQSSIEKGANLVYGGYRYNHPKYSKGFYFMPTLITEVTPEMEIAQNELFSPVILLMEAKNVNHAIEIANSTKYGLGGSVFGDRNDKDVEKVVNQMEVGNIAVNDFATFYTCQLPFGGCKKSGYGKFGGEEGLLGLCMAKSICYDKYYMIHTSIPKVLDYPIKSLSQAWNFVEALNVGGYSSSIRERIFSIFRLANSSRG